jgi:hypothetical protein
MLKRRGRIQCGQPNRPSAAGDGNAFRLSGLLLPSSFYLWRILPRLFSRSGAAESAPIVPPQSPPADTVTPSTTADSGSQASGGIMSNGTTNSEGTVNGDAESSKMASTM